MSLAPGQKKPAWLSAALMLLFASALLLFAHRMWQLMHPPFIAQGRLFFKFGPTACEGIFKGTQESLEPCVVHAHYDIESGTKDLVVFLPQAEVRIHDWQRQLIEIQSPLPQDPDETRQEAR